MLGISETAVALIDVQGKLAQVVQEREALYTNLKILVRASRVLETPLFVTEQNPDRMGRTVRELSGLFDARTVISKMAFSCWGEPRFRDALREAGKRQLVVCGIETHVCVYQTARDLVAEGYTVYVPADAVSSRTAENRETGLALIRAAGGHVSSVEAILFDLLKTAEHPQFREILGLVK